MTFVSRERRRMGRIAAVGGPVLVALVLATMPFVGFTAGETARVTALAAPVALVTGGVAWCLPWHRWRDETLLVVPITGLAGLALFGLASHGRAAVYGGYLAMLFLYVGLTQRPWRSVWLLALAVPSYFALYSGPDVELVARLPISVAVWLATAETVSRYRMRSRHVVADLEERAGTDPLTGLGNRSGLTALLGRLRPGDAVLLIDLDHFKRINDQLGHIAGDLVLRDLGTAVRSVTRARDHAVRYGGEEILLLLDAAGPAGAHRVDDRLRAAFSALQPTITYSAGIAVVGSPDLPPALQRADEALYQAKAGGRDRTVVAGEQPALTVT